MRPPSDPHPHDPPALNPSTGTRVATDSVSARDAARAVASTDASTTDARISKDSNSDTNAITDANIYSTSDTSTSDTSTSDTCTYVSSDASSDAGCTPTGSEG